MQTVNFRCGHCNNLMAVGLEFIGQQVRCPHCQNVVVAPSSVPQPAPVAEPDNPFPRIAESEDIFSSSAQPTDSLFDEPAHSLVELPASPLVTPDHTLTPEPTPVPSLFLEPTNSQPPVTHEASAPSFLHGAETFSPPTSEHTESATTPWMSSPSENGQAAPAEPSFADSRKPREPRPVKINWFMPLVFLPLLLYAVLTTVALAFLYLRMASAPPTLFDQMPDTQGDTPGTRPTKSQGQIFNIDKKIATRALPEHLKVALGSTLIVGDLEVTPTKLERGHFGLLAETAREKAEPSPNEALKLTLRLKNIAKDYAFTPLDNFFDRKWSVGDSGATPLTLLQAGSTTYYGGPAKWFSLTSDKNRRPPREWLEGRKDVDREGLAPGETTDTFVCTDGWNPAVQLHLFGLDAEGTAGKQKPYSGNLLWRIQLRRGLIDYKGRKLPATAVIGVEFTSADLPKTAIRQES